MKAGRPELMDFLTQLDIKTTTHEHEAVFTVEESSHIKDNLAGGHTKNLFLKDKKGRYFLITVGAYATINLKTLHTRIGASGRLSFGSAEKLDEYLGLYPGAVSVFGMINDHNKQVTLILDKTLMQHDTINAHPMTNKATTNIKRSDLLKFIEATGHNATIIAITEKEA